MFRGTRGSQVRALPRKKAFCPFCAVYLRPYQFFFPRSASLARNKGMCLARQSMSIPGIMVLPFSDCYGWAEMLYQLEPLAGGSGRNRHGETERQSGSKSAGDCNTASIVVGIAMLRPTVTPSSKAIASIHRETQPALASMSSRFMFDAKSRVNDTSCSVPPLSHGNIHRNLSLSSTTIICNGISLQKPCIASNQVLSAAEPLHSAKAP
jgi:hypothetical protein